MARTIYDCYRINGYRSGFWVRRNSWEPESSFFVKRIGQQTSGRLPQHGALRSDLIVRGDFYLNDVITTRNSRLDYADTFSWSYLGPEKGISR